MKNSFTKIPGLVDVHVHLREPGFSYKETIRTGSMAAAASGYSHIFSMPNLNPVPDSLENLKVQLEIIRRDSVINVIPYGSITVGEKGEKLSQMEAMAPFVAGFSDDGHGVDSPLLMEKAMVVAKDLNKIIVAHCEDMKLRGNGYIHDGNYAKAHGHAGISSESEWKPIARDLELAAKTGCKYHVCHISSKESVEVIRQAKASGVDVTCETAPHYLIFSDKDLIDHGRFKMNPPIRAEKDRLALIEGIKDGTIDMIATDHAPHSQEEKSKGLIGSAMGVSGIETAFPVLYTQMVLKGLISLDDLINLMSTNPRKRFELPVCDLDTDYGLWDLEEEYIINPDNFISMGHSTPFCGMKVFGRCKETVLNGKPVWRI